MTMDLSTGMSYYQHQIHHKNWVRKVITVSLCRVSIRSQLYLEFHKIEQDGAHAKRDGAAARTKWVNGGELTPFTQRNGFHYHILVFFYI